MKKQLRLPGLVPRLACSFISCLLALPAAAPAADPSPGSPPAPTTANAPRDWSKASVEQTLTAANQGDVAAQFFMGLQYELGSGVPRNFGEAEKFYRLAANQGHAMAQNNLGNLFQQGWGVPKNEEEALKWYRKSAEQGEPYGQCNLGWLLAYGRKIERDRDQAESWMRKAADQGFAQAQYFMGYMSEHQAASPGKTVTGNYQVASEWYQKAAGQGHPRAMFNLGELYYYGKLGHNHPEAAMWFRQAADSGYDDAVLRLAELYRNPHTDLPADPIESARWYRIAAGKGNAKAQYALGCLLLDTGKPGPDPATAAEAREWLRKAADNGYTEAALRLAQLDKLPPESILAGRSREELIAASYNGNGETRLLLGRAYEEGLGGGVNLRAAAEAYWRILNLGPAKDQAEASRRLIRMYAEQNPGLDPEATYGPRTNEAFAKLIEGYSRLITSPEAQLQVGELLLRGDLLPLDKPSAVRWLTRAAKNGSAPAMNRLGELWAAGLGGQPDPAEALNWYRRAATNGWAAAQYNAGCAYQKGEGTAADPVEAAAWFSLAADQDHAAARQAGKQVEAAFSPEQRERARIRKTALVNSMPPAPPPKPADQSDTK